MSIQTNKWWLRISHAQGRGHNDRCIKSQCLHLYLFVLYFHISHIVFEHLYIASLLSHSVEWSPTGSCEQQPALWATFLGLAGSLGICGMSFTGSLPTAHCLPHLCVGSALHRGTSPILSPELCCSTVTIQRRISLRSSAKAELLVPRTRTVIRQRRAFSVAAGPTTWNGLPVALHLTPVAHSALFLSSLKTTLFDRGWAGSAPY